MDLRSGACYWPLQDGLIRAYPPLRADADCDVAVVGAGFTGALIAHRLAASGRSVVVLDRRDAAWGSTLASTGLLQYEIDVGLAELSGMIGWEDARAAYLMCRDAIGAVESIADRLGARCGFERRGSLLLASRAGDVEGLRREYEARVRAGLDVRWLGREAIGARYSFAREGAVLSRDGAQVDAYRMTHLLLGAAAARGARVYDRTAVAAYRAPEGTRERVELATDRGPVVRARRVVLALGYEAQMLLKEKVVDLKSTYALVTEPIDGFAGWEDRCLMWETARPYFYLRTTGPSDGARRAMIGGLDEGFRDPERRDALIEAKAAALMAEFRARFPRIETEGAFAWAGTFGETKDGLAYFGEVPEYPGAIWTLGFGGNGMTFSAAMAGMVETALRGEEAEGARVFRFGR